MTRPRLAFALLACLALSLPARASVPAKYVESFNALSTYLDREELDAMDSAKAFLLVPDVFAKGTQETAYAQSRYIGAKMPGEAVLSALVLICNGTEGEHQLVRTRLERDVNKRRWAWNMVGSEAVFFESIEEGRTWQSGLSLLPSASRLGQFAALCLQSKDLLTRRVGLFAGYWAGTADFWSKAATVSKSDPDAVTRRIAARLITQRPR